MKFGKLISLCVASLLVSVSGALAQTFPTQTVRIIVPFSAGSNTDIFARAIADKLDTMWGQKVIVENKPGIPGAVAAAGSTPDGYTLMLTTNGHTILGFLNKQLPFDPIEDFAAVSEIASVPLVLAATPELPVNSLKELIALARQKPGVLNFSSAGLASSTYIAGELVKQTAKIDIVHVPYRGTPEQLTSLMRGDAQLSMAFLGTALTFIQAGKIHALAVSTAQRIPSLPDVPTFAEAGMPEFQYNSWFGVLAPAKVPAPILKKISDDIAVVLKMPDVRNRWDTLGAVPVDSTREQFGATIRADAERYGKLLKAAGVEAK